MKQIIILLTVAVCLQLSSITWAEDAPSETISNIPGGGWTYALNSEATYDWTADQFTMPFNLAVSKMFDIASKRLSSNSVPATARTRESWDQSGVCAPV